MQALDRLLELLAALRDPLQGDPWHKDQDFSSIAPYTIEESYEVADAIERENMEDLRAELGDLLFQVIYHAQLASEKGVFTFADVVAALERKLKERQTSPVPAHTEGHPGPWQRLKMAKRLSPDNNGHTSLLDEVPLNLPALHRAQKLQANAATAGFDWREAREVLEKIAEEINELESELQDSATQASVRHELGDVLFACVNLARHLRVDAEGALRSANRRFEQRFRYIEDRLRERHLVPGQVSLAEMDSLWEEAKRRAG